MISANILFEEDDGNLVALLPGHYCSEPTTKFELMLIMNCAVRASLLGLANDAESGVDHAASLLLGLNFQLHDGFGVDSIPIPSVLVNVGYRTADNCFYFDLRVNSTIVRSDLPYQAFIDGIGWIFPDSLTEVC